MPTACAVRYCPHASCGTILPGSVIAVILFSAGLGLIVSAGPMAFKPIYVRGLADKAAPAPLLGAEFPQGHSRASGIGDKAVASACRKRAAKAGLADYLAAPSPSLHKRQLAECEAWLASLIMAGASDTAIRRAESQLWRIKAQAGRVKRVASYNRWIVKHGL